MIQRISITKINCEIVPVDSNLPSGERYPPFEQLEPDVLNPLVAHESGYF